MANCGFCLERVISLLCLSFLGKKFPFFFEADVVVFQQSHLIYPRLYLKLNYVVW